MLGKRARELVGDLQQQRAGKPVFEIGRDEPVDMGEVVPDRALQQNRRNACSAGGVSRSSTADRAPLLLELRGQRGRDPAVH